MESNLSMIRCQSTGAEDTTTPTSASERTSKNPRLEKMRSKVRGISPLKIMVLMCI